MNKISLQKLSRFFNVILIFSIIFDPTNLFKIKDISFVLFVLCSLPSANYKRILIPMTFLITFINSFLIGLFFKIPTDYLNSLNIIKSYFFLFYIIWMENKLNEIKYFYSATKILSWITIFLFITMFFFKKYEILFYTFIHYTLKDSIMIARRNFYGFSTMMIYFRTSALLSISLSISLSLFFTEKKKKYGIDSIFFLIALICSGTRANMLAGVLIFVGISLYYILHQKKQMFIFVTLFTLFMFFTFLIIFLLLTVKEESTAVKGGHLISYINLFKEKPFLYLLIGSGPGSLFYTAGFDSIVPMTELTYFDMIKNYGFIQSLVLICIFCSPILGIVNNTNLCKLEKFSIILGWIGYLFIAGTNPLLISSTGFIAFSIIIYITTHSMKHELLKIREKPKYYFRKSLLLKYVG